MANASYTESRLVVICSRARSLINFRGALLSEWMRRGFAVHAICPKEDRGTPVHAALLQAGVEVHFVRLKRTGKGVFSDLRLFFQLLNVLIEVRPRIVFAYTIKPVIYGLLAASLLRIPRRFAMITGLGHVFISRSRGFLFLLVRSLYSLALRQAHFIFFQNPDDRELFHSLGLVSSPERSLVINGSGVDLNHFRYSFPQSDRIRFLFVGRLLKSKGIREYAQAAIEILRANMGVQCQIVGWMDDNPDAIDASELRAWQRAGIEYKGHLEDVRPVLEECSVLVLPSYREGTPRTVLEAMAVGRAVITTDAPGCRETVIEGENGFLVDVGSVESLVGAMRKFVEDPSLAVRMGRNSRRIAEYKYDVHRVNFEILAGMGLVVRP